MSKQKAKEISQLKLELAHPTPSVSKSVQTDEGQAASIALHETCVPRSDAASQTTLSGPQTSPVSSGQRKMSYGHERASIAYSHPLASPLQPQSPLASRGPPSPPAAALPPATQAAAHDEYEDDRRGARRRRRPLVRALKAPNHHCPGMALWMVLKLTAMILGGKIEQVGAVMASCWVGRGMRAGAAATAGHSTCNCEPKVTRAARAGPRSQHVRRHGTPSGLVAAHAAAG